MKYLVEVEEWENQQKLYKNIGVNNTLSFIAHALKSACWGEKEEIENSINLFLSEHQNNIVDRICNPMLTIISAIRAYQKMVEYFNNTNPEKLKEFYDGGEK